LARIALRTRGWSLGSAYSRQRPGRVLVDRRLRPDHDAKPKHRRFGLEPTDVNRRELLVRVSREARSGRAFDIALRIED
jgi:hypothetical protein